MRQTDRDRQRDRQTDRQTYRQRHRERDREINTITMSHHRITAPGTQRRFLIHCNKHIRCVPMGSTLASINTVGTPITTIDFGLSTKQGSTHKHWMPQVMQYVVLFSVFHTNLQHTLGISRQRYEGSNNHSIAHPILQPSNSVVGVAETCG